MSNTYWLVNLSLENFNISKKRSFDLLGFTKKDNKLTNKINVNDQVLFYVSDNLTKLRQFYKSQEDLASDIQKVSPAAAGLAGWWPASDKKRGWRLNRERS